MNLIHRLFPWKRTLLLSLCIIPLVIIFGFYGFYTNKIYLFKLKNYVLPIFSIIHAIYLYVLWFKIKEDEVSDIQMRNIEYAFYIVIAIYLYKLIDITTIVFSYGEYTSYNISSAFIPLGILAMLLQILLIGLSILAIHYRKQKVGGYNFEELNNKIDTWD